jgi:hypothetical protein
MRVVAATETHSPEIRGPRRRGAQKVVLNARDNVTEFYAKDDYAVVGEVERFSVRFAMCE